MAYRYQKTGKYLVSIDQSIFSAFLSLVVNHRKNNLDSLGLSWSRVARILKILLRSKFKVVEAGRCIHLPVFGHLGLQVHRGVKLFDFTRFEVAKVFASHISREEADAEIAASRNASAIAIAPRFLMADADARWYNEEYIAGAHATDLVSPDSSDFLRYYPAVENCLLELASNQPPTEVKTAEYFDSLANGDFADRWSAAGIDATDVNFISSYIDSLRAWLGANAKFDSSKLVLTHGDFSLVNGLVSDGELRIVDWEGISPRSVLGDIFNFALAERFYGRTSPNFVAEAESLFDHYRTALISRCPELKIAASMDEQVARRIYYLERIRLMVDRDASPNISRVVKKSILMFNQFDIDTGGTAL